MSAQINFTAQPAAVRVTVDPLMERVVIVVGDFSFGLSVEDALIMSNHVEAACVMIAAGGKARKQ